MLLFGRLMEGGADTGFRHVEADKYPAHLFHFCGVGKNVVVKQVYRRAVGSAYIMKIFRIYPNKCINPTA